MGGLLECRRRPKYCDDDILALMSFRLWDGGWQVAALPAGATADAAGDAPSAASIDKFYAAKATAARVVVTPPRGAIAPLPLLTASLRHRTCTRGYAI